MNFSETGGENRLRIIAEAACPVTESGKLAGRFLPLLPSCPPIVFFRAPGFRWLA
jgi:hypothetical protein